MSTEISAWTPPTLQELSNDLETAAKNDILNIALNLEPPASWIRQHPTIRVKIGEDEQGRDIKEPLKYISIDRQRFLGRRIFGNVIEEIQRECVMFQSVVVTVRIRYKHPITGEDMYQDGIGAQNVQTDAGTSAADLSKIKSDAVMKAAPSAASYAFKNAYDKIGRLFGGELQKKAIQFTDDTAMYAKSFFDAPNYDDLKELYDLKKESLTPDEITNADRILNNREINSFIKLYKILQSR